MEDTKSLLMMVLHKVFQNQPKTIENTFQLIHSYNNGKTDKKNYEKTLKAICDLMNDELPSPILVYILTLVDMPQDFDSSSPIIEKMKKTHDFLPEINVRPHLLEYLNNIKPTIKNRNIEKAEISEKSSSNPAEPDKISAKPQSNFVRPTRVLKRTRKFVPKITGSPKSLLDICATYVVQNEFSLKGMYRKKQSNAWRLINANVFLGPKLKQCYNVVKDLNKKMRWLREIESDNISTDTLMEEYKTSDVFLKENHIYEALQKDPFELSEECEAAIESLLD
ncbi:uncharacterized protein LOC123010728 [Tribolium madens]|uniref:uncharacterized protein LOC123010728 n=1 Tax=Tribolium madens TaxID=41895 RepID=UPI001CF756BA|nr:uncharacterized protein LOC123010728 [Tribolium madens]